jgi:putative endonuclease
MREHQYFVYIATNYRNTVLYTGVTNDLARRMNEHRRHLIPGFTDRYNIEKLVYYEMTDYVPSAIQYEKQIKGLLRKKKIALIEQMNPMWRDLSGLL